jgi:hypothetical protein
MPTLHQSAIFLYLLYETPSYQLHWTLTSTPLSKYLTDAIKEKGRKAIVKYYKNMIDVANTVGVEELKPVIVEQQAMGKKVVVIVFSMGVFGGKGLVDQGVLQDSQILGFGVLSNFSNANVVFNQKDWILAGLK